MALGGIRVLDLTRLLPGAYCTLLLADMGADVVKVEEPGRGDPMRWYPPLVDGQSALFNTFNRNKRSLTLNLKSAPGQRLFRDLARTADVVLEGNRPGVMDRLGLGWATLRELNPKLVMAAITGYGQDGPWAQHAGHDINYMAISGGLSLNAGRWEPPHPLAVQVADLGGGGQGAATAILGALLEVARGGEGRFLDISMTDGALSWLAVPLAQVTAGGGPVPRGMHRLTGRYACYGVYTTRDGRFYSVGALEAKFWEALCEALGRPDLVPLQYEDGRQDEIREALATAFAARTRDEWEQRLGGLEVCCEPVLEVEEVAGHPQVLARALVREQPTGTEIAPAVPMPDGWRRLGPPRLGEHSAELLGEVGVAAAELAGLRAEGAS